MSSFHDLAMIPKILRIFQVKNLVISNVDDEKLIDEIKKSNFNVTFINVPDENSIKGNPLKILPTLENFDAIFIGGDANWFTVFNELNIIKESNNEFPLVFICNNNFPNKRRDSYINPEIIPSEYRQKHVKELPICHNGEKINIIDGCYHACDENTPKNGVLTAIEDFLSMYSSIGFIKINFMSEITILYQKIQINEKRVNIIINDMQDEETEDINLSDKLLENELLISYINKYDLHNEDFKGYDVEISKKNDIINDYENKLLLQDTEIDYKESQIKNIESKLSLKNSQIKNIESKLVNKEKMIVDLQNQLKNANDSLNNNEIIFNKKIRNIEDEFNVERTFENSDINSLKMKLFQNEENFKNSIDIKNSDIQQKDIELKIKQQELNDKEQRLNSLKYAYMRQLSKIDKDEYCINCFKEEISNNHLEIKYFKNNILIKKLLSPMAYLYLILKSDPSEISINIKLYRALKDSECFDIGFYLNNNRDLLESKWCKYFSPELHYVCNGFKEVRKFNRKYFNRNSKKELLDYLLNCDK